MEGKIAFSFPTAVAACPDDNCGSPSYYLPWKKKTFTHNVHIYIHIDVLMLYNINRTVHIISSWTDVSYTCNIWNNENPLGPDVGTTGSHWLSNNIYTHTSRTVPRATPGRR